MFHRLLLATAIILAPVFLPVDTAAVEGIRYEVDAESSKARYIVGEYFLVQGNVFRRAVGETRAISGSILLRLDSPDFLLIEPFEVDLRELVSDDPHRDEDLRNRWLESSRFPIAAFVARAVERPSDEIAPGRPVPIAVEGELTIRRTTKPVRFTGNLTYNEETVTAELSGAIQMTDFGIRTPVILGVLRAENDVKIELELLLRRVAE